MEENISNFIHDIIDKDLETGKVKHVHTRFPPEPNGYLHIGSAKAIWINYTTAKKYGGKFNLRYDDTNPLKEDEEYVLAIEEDLRWLGAEPDGGIFYGSDYFDKCYEFAEKLIKDGKAFVCDLSQEEISKYRGTLTQGGTESPYRNRSVEENLDLFRRMKAGEFPDGAKTLRAKIDMDSPNMNMRDPVIYRIIHAEHHRQGNKWCIYPMYDFAHPIQDALEGISHSLCSIEFENHRPLYDWVLENLGFKDRPYQYEFARLNMTYTVMSKRYLRKLVETKKVDGWDDPRMPTLSGLRRRGYTPTAIFNFIEKSGVSKNYSIADIRFLEYCICEELNETALRRIAVIEPLKVTITNYPEDKIEYFETSNHPKNPEFGKRSIPFSRNIYIEKSDFMVEPIPGFKRLSPGREVRLMSAYIIKCNEVIYDENGNVKELLCTADLEAKNNKPADGRKVKGTIHWLSEHNTVDMEVREYNPIFNKENVSTLLEDDNFEEFLSDDSLVIYKNCKLEKLLENAKAGERFQFVRMGYYTKDSKYDGVFNQIAPLKSSFKPE
ncbi:MAG: glutamine--tRNA ligase/YqeY domain fusion protein [Eubacteriales bacterium]|nr:glutamine--tRNA ligase/YqeY domain fusion protein [Eubacteriales bacterium]